MVDYVPQFLEKKHHGWMDRKIEYNCLAGSIFVMGIARM